MIKKKNCLFNLKYLNFAKILKLKITMAKNLVIVESPAKARTIEKILGKDYSVKSCNGHVRDLSKKDLSIDIDNSFQPKYTIIDEKKTLVKELSQIAKKSEKVLLATDEDREGEAISWHLVEALELDEDKTERITFHEITKKAILNSLNQSRKINYELVNAQQARRVLDRLVGYELSPLLWRKVKPALSAGRVQSVATRLIVDREEEINAHTAKSNFNIVGLFTTKSDNNSIIKAQLSHRYDKKEEAAKFLESCKNTKFQVLDIETKPFTKSSSAPFTTSSLQQEASRKLGFSVSKTMIVAQQLYETGKITYMRTDSVNLSDIAIAQSKDIISKLYGENYSNPRQFQNKIKGAQEAHEAIRPTEISVEDIPGTKDQKRLYELIWKRTIASQMSNAIFDRTTIQINSPEPKYFFVAKGEVLKFDGFLKIYSENTDDETTEEDTSLLPLVQVNEALDYKEINATQKFSTHSPRYTEAALVRKLEELGIGRPSTYAPTISTIMRREYVVKDSRDGQARNYEIVRLVKKEITEETKQEIVGSEKNKLFPTDIGILVTQFLKESFPDILDYSFTAKVEKQFDEIAMGKVVWNDMINSFYKTFHPQIEKISTESKKFVGERLLGVDPKTKQNVYAKIGRYGPIIQIGETGSDTKPLFASLLKTQSIHSIVLEEALQLFSFPLNIGKHNNEDVYVNDGPYGPYIKHAKANYKIPQNINPLELSLEQAIKIISNKNDNVASNILKTFDEDNDLSLRKGRWGTYIKFKNKNYKIPKGTEIDSITYKICMEIIEESDKNTTPSKRNFKKK